MKKAGLRFARERLSGYGGHMKRMFRTEAVIYLPMGETETLKEAEDRFLDLADNCGFDVLAYRDPELLTFDTPVGEENDVAEGKQIP